jgi:hypothetical protein
MKKITQALVLASTILTNSHIAYAEQSASDRYFYIGGSAGISEPVIKEFEHSSKTKIRLKKSEMIGGKIGYSFYPNMMVEFSGSYHPTFKLAYKLPEKPIPVPGIPAIPVTAGRTKVRAQAYLINLIYEAEPIAAIGGIKPSVIFGGGVTQVVVHEAQSFWQSPFGNTPYFKVKKTTTYCPTWQAGIGLAKDVSSNFSMNISTKFQVVRNIKINYDTLNGNAFLATFGTTKEFNRADPIKKTIAVGEFALGFTYKLPF